ncbi:hypothetical protein FRC20_007786 [Serendipita sp. 405]|nr:hypothetical protein FRC20_007786 [Serendipita sp. 405]
MPTPAALVASLHPILSQIIPLPSPRARNMAQICTNCVEGHRLPGEPKGTLLPTIAPLDAYFISGHGTTEVPSSASFTKTKNAIVIMTDIFGLSIPNLKVVADILASQLNTDVWVPDIFRGNTPVREDAISDLIFDEPGKALSWWQTIRKYIVYMRAMPALKSFRPDIQDPWAIEFLTNLRSECKYDKITVVGYCWGGGIAVRLATRPKLVDSVIAVHPSGQFKDDMIKTQVPIAFFIAEEDHQWDPEAAVLVQETWKLQEEVPKHLFKTYKGTVHGFGSRPNLSIPQVKKSWEQLMGDIVSWLKETM